MKLVGRISLLLLLFSVWPGPAAHAQSAVSYSRSANDVVVEFRESLSELRALGAGPSLRIHGDGRFEVHRPAYMKRAGNWSGQLTPAELDALVTRLAERGVLGFDASAPMRAASPSGGRMPPETSDASTVELVVRAARRPVADSRRVSPDPLPSAAPPPVVRVVLRGLRGAVRARPDDPALAGLAAACEELRRMIDSPELAAAP